MKCKQIHSFYPKEEAGEDDEEDDIMRAQREVDAWVGEQRIFVTPACCNGNNEVVKNFNQKCLIGFENPGVSAFRQCGHVWI